MLKQKIAIIGGGPSAMMLAAFLDPELFEVTIYEQNKALGRKFLVAGKGGFNLTHSEPLASFVQRYTPQAFIAPFLSVFNNQDLRQWLDTIGIPTYIGSSKRVYPIKGIKPITVLQYMLKFLAQKGVKIAYEYEWTGWDTNQNINFQNKGSIEADLKVFALGGGSWQVTGTNDRWLSLFQKQGVSVQAFKSANCAYQIAWSEAFLHKHEGKALKNIAVSYQGQTQKGEAVITKFGIEGNAIYALSPKIQATFDHSGPAQVSVDLKPQLTSKTILERLQKSKAKNTTQALRQAINLNSTKVDLIKQQVSKEQFQNLEQLTSTIKALPLTLRMAAPIDEAISTTGGIPLTAVDEHLQLKALPNHYCIGEMLDWNAPTGGYLLQACFSMGVYLAQHLNGSPK